MPEQTMHCFFLLPRRFTTRFQMLNLPVPVVIRSKIEDWKIRSFEQKDWCCAFRGKELRFRKGHKLYREEPYWEQICEEETMSIDEFFERSKTEAKSDHWLYFDYKYMKDVFSVDDKLLQEIKWEDVGLGQLSGKDSTMWIGNKGAHTPCHIDTYGCNFVAQIYGRKLWILIPPDEMEILDPIRVPYEESSIYSSHNFYTPNTDILRIKNAYKVILNPGEVLHIPERWWHYVENLEIAVSVNVWIPRVGDHERRLEEALIRHYVSTICQDLTETDARTLLNPNEYDMLSSPFDTESLRAHVANYKTSKTEEVSSADQLNGFLEIAREESIAVEKFEENEMKEYIKNKCRAHNYTLPPRAKSPDGNKDTALLAKALINSYCHPSVIQTVKERLLKSWP